MQEYIYAKTNDVTQYIGTFPGLYNINLLRVSEEAPLEMKDPNNSGYQPIKNFFDLNEYDIIVSIDEEYMINNYSNFALSNPIIKSNGALMFLNLAFVNGFSNNEIPVSISVYKRGKAVGIL